MAYCALLIPQAKIKKEEKNVGFIQNLGNKLLSGVKDGGLNFENATTVLKNTASLISENIDTIANKFSGIALTQLLKDGKITNDTAFDYLTQGFPKALNMTSVAMGFQSVEQLKTSLKNGINVQQFITSFQNFGGALSEFANLNDTRKDVEGFEIIELDAVMDDSRNYSSETPDRRVESGQTYQEFIHNMPDIITLQCVLQDGRRYAGDEFEDILLNIRNRKIAINIILGDTTKESYVLTNFTPTREAMGGYNYTLEFKKIQVGDVQLTSLNISTSLKTTVTSVVDNALNPNDTKTIKEKALGFYKKVESDIYASRDELKQIVEGKK